MYDTRRLSTRSQRLYKSIQQCTQSISYTVYICPQQSACRFHIIKRLLEKWCNVRYATTINQKPKTIQDYTTVYKVYIVQLSTVVSVQISYYKKIIRKMMQYTIRDDYQLKRLYESIQQCTKCISYDCPQQSACRFHIIRRLLERWCNVRYATTIN